METRTKYCKECMEEKDLSQFIRHRNGVDVSVCICNECKYRRYDQNLVKKDNPNKEQLAEENRKRVAEIEAEKQKDLEQDMNEAREYVERMMKESHERWLSNEPERQRILRRKKYYKK